MTIKKAYKKLRQARGNLSEEEIFDLECIVAENAYYSYYYAREILKGRFELCEVSTSKHPNDSVQYARDIIEGRFELGERAIAKNPTSSCEYAMDVLRGRFELGEKAIAKDEICSYHYVYGVLKRKFILNESPALKKIYENYRTRKKLLTG